MDRPVSPEAPFNLTRPSKRVIFHRRYARWIMTGVLATTDIVILALIWLVVLLFWSQINPTLMLHTYTPLAPMLVVFPVAYILSGLYPGIGLSPVEELRRLTLSTTAVFMGLATLSFWLRNIDAYSRASFGLTWAFSLVLLPLARGVLRSVLTRQSWWGEPVAIIGYGAQGAAVLRYLERQPSIGLRPVVAVDGFLPETPPASIPLIHAVDIANPEQNADLAGLQTAIVIPSEIPTEFLKAIIDDHWYNFSHLVMISTDTQVGSVWIRPYDLGGVLGLEVRQNLLSSFQQNLKRVTDLLFILVSAPVMIPLMGLLALLVRLDSPGGVFYTQSRVGQGGREIRIWKFRTMVADAEKRLETYLQEHPELRDEWEANHKLRDDPRVTRVGGVLRRLSLDEFPQLWNVLRGEMSLVGPRPIVTDEIKHYNTRFKLYAQVKPGMTGMWQVSGRNDVSYEERVQLDEYYVRNWSIWLDFYILARTLLAVIGGRGAY